MSVTTRNFNQPEDPNDSRSYFEVGQGFQIAAGMAMRYTQRKDIPEMHAQRLLPPWITSYGFATELYLKCLLLEQGVPYKQRYGHNLYELFLKLKSDTKSKLIQRYDQYVKRPEIQFVFDYSRKINPDIKLDFESVIQDCSKAFEDWLYIFENFDIKKIKPLTGQQAVVEVLEAEIITNHPEFDKEK